MNFDFFRKQALKSKRIEENVLNDSNELLIENLQLNESKYLKRAAVLLFHPLPEKYVTGAYIKIGFFESDSELIFQDEIHGNLFEQVEKTIDILINNAGIGITGSIEDTPTEGMREVFETNFFGAIEMMKAVLPQMRKQKKGLIINITSIAGYMGLPYRSVYSASKGALELITEALSMEVKEFGIHITNVAPGDFATNIASGRYHSPLTSGSDYEKSYGTTLEMMDAHVDGGSNPNDMAEAIFKIINTKKPKIHYKVGAFMQKFSIVLKRILPDMVYEKLLMNHYKL